MSLMHYENTSIRSVWDAEQQEWYFSIVDVVGVLTDQPTIERARNYWKVLKNRLKAEGNQTVTNCNRLKLPASDGKMRLTDVANTDQLLRLIQSIPSPKAEPFKVWLAQVGAERIIETIDPEQAIDRAVETYQRKGYDESWIHQRLMSIRVRNDLTDQWDQHGIQKEMEYAILTDELTRAWSGLSTRQYKELKGLKKENLRDNMTDLELVLNMLAEATTTELTKVQNPQGLQQNQRVVQRGGEIAGDARRAIEQETNRPVVTPANATSLPGLITGLLTSQTGDAQKSDE